MKRGYKVIISAAIAFGVTILPLQANVMAVSSTKSIAKQNKIWNKVKTKRIKKDLTNINVDLKIPVVQGIKDKKIQNDINSKIKNDIMKFSDESIKQANKDAAEMKKSNIPFRKYEAVTDFSLKYLKNNILSITTDEYSFTGGAHGNTLRTPYNFNTVNGKTIALKDLFKKGYDYKTVINKEIKRQMALNKDMMYYTNPSEAFKSISDNQTYYIKDGNIVIYFSQYEIAPYAAGFPEFPISVKLFDGNLNSEYKF